MSDPDGVIIRCTRVEDLPVVPVPSTQCACSACGRLVWVSDSTRDAAHARFPGMHVLAVCMVCQFGDGDHEIVNTPEQVEILRRLGDSDEVIAYKFAIAEVTQGCATLEEAEAEILAFPNGAKARAFPDALARATRLVAATRAPRN